MIIFSSVVLRNKLRSQFWRSMLRSPSTFALSFMAPEIRSCFVDVLSDAMAGMSQRKSNVAARASMNWDTNERWNIHRPDSSKCIAKRPRNVTAGFANDVDPVIHKPL